MASLIVPRPIALVTTLGPDGVVNAAPFSMFGMVGEDPPLVMISVNRLDDGAQKDTAANIDASGEFVVHLVDEPIARRMHRCGERYPRGGRRARAVGFTAGAGDLVGRPGSPRRRSPSSARSHEQIDTASRAGLLRPDPSPARPRRADRHRAAGACSCRTTRPSAASARASTPPPVTASPSPPTPPARPSPVTEIDQL